jgi:hypothetical protein
MVSIRGLAILAVNEIEHLTRLFNFAFQLVNWVYVKPTPNEKKK